MKKILIIVFICVFTKSFSQDNKKERIAQNVEGIGNTEQEAKLQSAKNAIFQVMGGVLKSVYREEYEKIVENYLDVRAEGYCREIGNPKTVTLSGNRFSYTTTWAVSDDALTQH